MLGLARARLWWSMVLVAVLAGCSKSTPSNPSPTPSASCRVFPATYTTVLTAGAFSQTTVGTCAFERATLQLTCTNNTSDTSGGSNRIVTITTWSTFDQVLREVSVSPPLVTATVVNASSIGTGGPSTSSVTYTYDGQGRLQRETGTAYATTYTAWDTAGHPTAGSLQPATGAASAQTLSYDATARTKSTTTTTAGQVSTCTQTFDANGNQVATACAGQVSTTNITAANQVCK